MTNALHFTQRLAELFRVGQSAFFVQTSEQETLDSFLRDFANDTGLGIREWNQASGWVDFDTRRSLCDGTGPARLDEDLAALREVHADRRLYVIRDLRLALDGDKHALARLRELLLALRSRPAGRMAVVLVSDALVLPPELAPLVKELPLPLPDRAEMSGLVARESAAVGLEVPGHLQPRLATAMCGMGEYDACGLLRRLRAQGSVLTSMMVEEALREKRERIGQNGMLEMVAIDDADSIGGLNLFREWLRRKALMINRLEEAVREGVTVPKGVLLAGMPGCGKSLGAKVVAREFAQPLLRLDVGGLLGKYVGESERNMRRALEEAEAMSPCVLWIDELDKAFTGSGGAQSEVNSHLLGHLLNWLQEKRAPVFVVATANDIGALPAELMRKGRFDELFYVGLPDHGARKEIFEAHLRLASLASPRFDFDELASASQDFSGADIGAAISEAREACFVERRTLAQSDLLAEIDKAMPMKHTLAHQIAQYQALFDRYKLRPASSSDSARSAGGGRTGGAGSGRRPCQARADDSTLSEVELMDLVSSDVLAPDMLAFLSGHRSEQVRAAVARNAKLDRQMEQRLVEDEVTAVRVALASNICLSPDIQRMLAVDASEQVRQRLAANRHICDHARALLARDVCQKVQGQLAMRRPFLRTC